MGGGRSDHSGCGSQHCNDCLLSLVLAALCVGICRHGMDWGETLYSKITSAAHMLVYALQLLASEQRPRAGLRVFDGESVRIHPYSPRGLIGQLWKGLNIMVSLCLPASERFLGEIINFGLSEYCLHPKVQ